MNEICTFDVNGRPVKVPDFREDILKHIIPNRRIAVANPLLSILTRSYQKPNCLKVCLESIDKQQSRCFENIILTDTKGIGLAAADQALDVYKDQIHGKYVMVLDDDDMFTIDVATYFIEDIANKYKPSIIIWRGYFTDLDIGFPMIDRNWGIFPQRAQIGSFNYCVASDLFREHIGKCVSGMSGDFDFLLSVYKSINSHQAYWLKKILVRTQQKSFGKTRDIK